MTATIPAPTRTNNRVNGSFYPLQKEELIALRKSRLINNSAFVHFTLRMSNPFCDRPIEFIPKEFSDAWEMPLGSVYEAIGKLKQKNIIDLKTGKINTLEHLKKMYPNNWREAASHFGIDMGGESFE